VLVLLSVALLLWRSWQTCLGCVVWLLCCDSGVCFAACRDHHHQQQQQQQFLVLLLLYQPQLQRSGEV
jgi:hypothetical protein